MKTGLKSKLRDKVPEIILEAVSVVLAVLLALAVDAWREDRSNAREAERARRGVLEEIASNHRELASNREDNRAVLDAVHQTLEAIEADPEKGGELSVDFSVSLLSSATWDTAKVTLSVHHLDFNWVARISKLYELQALYSRRQDELVSFLASGGAGDDDRMLESMHRRLTAVLELEDGLLATYETMHPDLGTDPAAEGTPQGS